MVNKLYRALTDRQRIMGIPFTYFATIIGIGYSLTFIFNLIYFNILLIPIYIFMRITSKKDPYFLDVYVEFLLSKDKYNAI